MRYLLVALMIALLPLRSWVGDAMAMGMAAQQVEIAEAKLPAERFIAAMPEDCAMLVTANSESAVQCSGCDTCNLCLAIASFANDIYLVSSFTPALDPTGSSTSFTSAYSASGLRPPIS